MKTYPYKILKIKKIRFSLLATAVVFLMLSHYSCREIGHTQAGANDTLAAVTHIELMKQEGFPVQINVKINGVLPDTCTGFKNIDQRRKDFRFSIILVTYPKYKGCSGSEAPFEVTVPLELNDLPKGNYTVNVNGKEKKFSLGEDNVSQ